MNEVQVQFKNLLQSFEDVKGEKFKEETIDRIIHLSQEAQLQKFMDFIMEDISDSGRFHIETQGIMMALADKNPNINAEELVKKYHNIWKL